MRKKQENEGREEKKGRENNFGSRCGHKRLENPSCLCCHIGPR